MLVLENVATYHSIIATLPPDSPVGFVVFGAGGRAMCEDGLMERFGIQEVYGMHNMPGIPLGQFAIREGAFFAGAQIRAEKTVAGLRLMQAVIASMQAEPVSTQQKWSTAKKVVVAILGVAVLLALAMGAFVAVIASSIQL